MINSNKKENIAFLGLNFSLFLFFGFFLSIKGAYSWAMGLALLTALGTLILWKFLYKLLETKVLSVFLLLLAVFWSHSFDGWATWSTEGDFFIKYVVGAFCAITLASMTASPRVLISAMAMGGISSGILAIYQFPILGRSEGFTNAIKFGDIAVYTGLACWLLAASRNFSFVERAILLFSGSMAVLASLLSLTRGGWIVMLCLPWLAMYFVPQVKDRTRWFGGLCLAVVLLVGIGSQVPALEKRMAEAEQEITGYSKNPEEYVHTSIGARLEQWRLSWALGASKPLTGWGEKGYFLGKEQFIESGEFHPFLREINHSHNDFFDMWAKRGIVGVLMLLVIYIVPVWIFYPTRKRVEEIAESHRSLFIALSLVGVMLPVSYFIFGWTDVFFNLSIGHNFFIFSLIFILASVNRVRQQHRVAAVVSKM